MRSLKKYKKNISIFFKNNAFKYFNNKEKIFNKNLEYLYNHHLAHCIEYRNIMKFQDKRNNKKFETINKLPFIPTNIFKEVDLMTLAKKDIYKTVRSSGTSSNQTSKIYLDKYNSIMQSKTLTHLYESFFKQNVRLPMLVIDNKSVLKQKDQFSARSAGIIGFSNFGTDLTFALDEKMNLDVDKIKNFIKKYEKKKNYYIWINLYYLGKIN